MLLKVGRLSEQVSPSVEQLMNELSLFAGLQPNKTSQKLIEIPLHKVVQANWDYLNMRNLSNLEFRFKKIYMQVSVISSPAEKCYRITVPRISQ